MLGARAVPLVSLRVQVSAALLQSPRRVCERRRLKIGPQPSNRASGRKTLASMKRLEGLERSKRRLHLRESKLPIVVLIVSHHLHLTQRSTVAAVAALFDRLESVSRLQLIHPCDLATGGAERAL